MNLESTYRELQTLLQLRRLTMAQKELSMTTLTELDTTTGDVLPFTPRKTTRDLIIEALTKVCNSLCLSASATAAIIDSVLAARHHRSLCGPAMCFDEAIEEGTKSAQALRKQIDEAALEDAFGDCPEPPRAA